MATSYITDPAPKLVPVLDGKKVVFSREEDAKASEAKADDPAKPTEQPKNEKQKS